jgi:hypothetical protein
MTDEINAELAAYRATGLKPDQVKTAVEENAVYRQSSHLDAVATAAGVSAVVLKRLALAEPDLKFLIKDGRALVSAGGAVPRPLLDHAKSAWPEMLPALIPGGAGQQARQNPATARQRVVPAQPTERRSGGPLNVTERHMINVRNSF